MLTTDRINLISKYKKLISNSLSEEYPANEAYKLKAEQLKVKNNILNSEIIEFNEIELKKQKDIREYKEKQAIFLNGIKFKTKDELKEYILKKPLNEAIYFVIRGIFNPLKPIKKNNN
jgi:hypothetical protein